MNFIKTFLFDAQSCVINNRYTTDYFKLERGTRQWDPLSAYLFIYVYICVRSVSYISKRSY